MSEHAKRMFKMGVFAFPPLDADERRDFDKWLAAKQQDPTHRREIKALFTQAKATVSAQLENGAGFEIDKLIRFFLKEFNGRNLSHGLLSMPSSFNAMEAFFEYDPRLSIFGLRDERDHVLSFVEFLDYVTSSDCPDDIREVVELVEENVIYSYNLVNDPGDITFSVRDGSEYGVGGIALIRHRHEVNILLLAGEKTDLDLKTQELNANFEVIAVMPGRERLRPADGLTRQATPLFDTKGFWQVLAMVRLNLEDMTYETRHLYWDAGDSFMGVTDDISVFMDGNGVFLKPELERDAKRSAERVGEYSALFEICKIALQLPAYFDFFGDLVAEERHETKQGQTKQRLESQRRRKFLAARDRINFRRVSVLHRQIERQPDRTLYMAPDFRIDESGFWRTLPPRSVGADKLGRPIHGRTWVRKVISWIEHNSESVPVSVNNGEPRIRSAREESQTNPGHIYVMRSAAHAKDIVKVGRTRRDSEVRSNELSRNTASPDSFLVCQEWAVTDCVAAEKMIHARLDRYRINPAREFFKAPYREIFKIIDDVINELDH